MVTGIPLLLIIALAILFIVLASSVLKLHPFLALVVASLGVGLAAGMEGPELARTLTEGFGSITGGIGLVIVFGTIIGVVMEESGAATRIAGSLVRLFGRKRIVLAMSCIGGFTGIPVFCDSGFIILSKLAQQMARQTGKSPVSVSIAVATGLYTTHVLVPPTPGPLAAAGNYGAEGFLGQVILVGLLLSVPGVLAGYWWALRSGRTASAEEEACEAKKTAPHAMAHGQAGETAAAETDQAQPDASAERAPGDRQLPPLFFSLLPLLLPVVLIAGGSVAALLDAPPWIRFISHPAIALLLGVFSSFFLFSKFDETHLNQWIGKAVLQAGPIILITAAGGAFGSVLKATPLNLLFESWINNTAVSGTLLLPLVFLLAAGLKTSQGSSTAAIIICSSLVAPVLPALGIDSGVELALLVSATGAGSMVVSHSNDSYFWVVSQFSGMSMGQTFKTFTAATLVQGIAILVFAMLFMSFL